MVLIHWEPIRLVCTKHTHNSFGIKLFPSSIKMWEPHHMITFFWKHPLVTLGQHTYVHNPTTPLVLSFRFTLQLLTFISQKSPQNQFVVQSSTLHSILLFEKCCCTLVTQFTQINGIHDPHAHHPVLFKFCHFPNWLQIFFDSHGKTIMLPLALPLINVKSVYFES